MIYYSFLSSIHKKVFLFIFLFISIVMTGIPTVYASTDKLYLTVKADKIVVFKKSRKLQLRLGDMILREYPIALGFNPVGDKEFEGDGRTPEGHYKIIWRNPSSDFFLSLKISYPDENDIRRAQSRGEKPGNMIMIHGLPNDRTARDVGHPDTDWTNGCIALNNSEIVEVWEMVNEDTPISIFP